MHINNIFKTTLKNYFRPIYSFFVSLKKFITEYGRP